MTRRRPQDEDSPDPEDVPTVGEVAKIVVLTMAVLVMVLEGANWASHEFRGEPLLPEPPPNATLGDDEVNYTSVPWEEGHCIGLLCAMLPVVIIIAVVTVVGIIFRVIATLMRGRGSS